LPLAVVLAGCGAVQPVDPTPGVVSVTIDQGDTTLAVGETVQLSATVEVVGGASTSVLWGSDDPDVATVAADGTVTAVGVGSAVITATSVANPARSDAITVEVLPPLVTIDAQGETLEPEVLETVTVPANSMVLLELRYPAAGTDLMFLEIDPVDDGDTLQLELWDATAETRLLVSRSPELFATSTEVLGAPVGVGPATAERSSISIGWTCFGPCVAQPYRAGTSYARVVNLGDSERTVDVYAYGLHETDENEPNDTPATATEVVATGIGEAVSGAIEHVDDVDYFSIECDPVQFPFGTVVLELATEFEGDIALTAGGQDYRAGEATQPLPCGSLVHVRTLDGTAGPSSASNYSILID
jgi:hypothetical protein